MIIAYSAHNFHIFNKHDRVFRIWPLIFIFAWSWIASSWFLKRALPISADSACRMFTDIFFHQVNAKFAVNMQTISFQFPITNDPTHVINVLYSWLFMIFIFAFPGLAPSVFLHGAPPGSSLRAPHPTAQQARSKVTACQGVRHWRTAGTDPDWPPRNCSICLKSCISMARQYVTSSKFLEFYDVMHMQLWYSIAYWVK